MRRIVLICAVCASVLALPAAAPAKGKSTDKLAAATCAKERKEIGRRAFTRKYGERSMPTCIRRTRARVRAAQRQAEQECADELAVLGFEEFAEDYGSDETGSDAMANCIAETLAFILSPPDDSGDPDEQDL